MVSVVETKDNPPSYLCLRLGYTKQVLELLDGARWKVDRLSILSCNDYRPQTKTLRPEEILIEE